MRTLPLLRWVLITVLAVMLVPASPALADPARPGNTVSEVDALIPPVAGVVADVVGGDAFVRLRAEPGVEVRVPGYLGEPYLWIRSDGTVWRNAESPATVLNEDRYLTADVPDVTTRPDEPLPEPVWERYGSGGTVLWHDHRAHWMGSGDPPTIDPDGLVQRWELPIEVDGVEVLISGRLLRRPGASPWWWSLAVVVGGLAAAAARRSSSALAWSTVGVGTLVATVGWWSWWSLPSPARSAPVIGIMAVAAASIGVVLTRRYRGVWVGPVQAGAGTALVIAAWLGRHGVTAAVIPGSDPTWPWRFAMTTALGAGIVVVAVGVRRSLGPPSR